jgi:CheY-like chemotaxis protein
MPGEINGLEATRQIKAIKDLTHIPILALSASVKPEDIQVAYSAGCSEFIRKPVDINELPVSVAKYIAGTSAIS